VLKCATCRIDMISKYYACSKLSEAHIIGHKSFELCLKCYHYIKFLDKMTLISTIKSKVEKLDQKDLIEWVRKLFRNIKRNDPQALITKINLIEKHDYKWFEMYELTGDTVKFNLVQEIELYVA
jgi:hypothetical protein